jgi:hypothetical protein
MPKVPAKNAQSEKFLSPSGLALGGDIKSFAHKFAVEREAALQLMTMSKAVLGEAVLGNVL